MSYNTDPEYNNGAIIDVVGNGSDFFKREVTTNGVRIMGAGAVGGQAAVPDAWLEKVARMFELFTDPTGAGINETAQRNVIKTLSGDAGTYHAAQGPTLQRVARGAGSDYTPNFLTDAGIVSWNLSPLFDSHVANDMVWYLNSTGDGYGVGEIDAQEVIEHVFHTLHMHGLDAVSLKMYPFISADWATGPLYAAMVEAYDGGFWDPSGYGGANFKTDSDAFEVAAKEYLYLLNFSMFEYTGLWDGDSLAPEWADTVRTAAQIQTNLPLGYALFNSYIAPGISKPSLATINSIFGDGNTPAQDDPSLAGASGYVVDTVASGEITKIDVTFGGYGYTAAPIVEIYDTNGGIGATARAVVTNGAVTKLIVNDGGSGYDPLTTSVTFNTESLRSFIVEHDANDAEENIRAYLDRSLSSVTSGTYLGLNAGFSVGDVFAVNESGDDGTGYAIPGYFAGDYSFTGGSNNAVIRVAAVDTSGVPTSWSIINPGEGFRNAQTVITLTSKTGEELDVTLFTKYLYSYDGKYKDDRGKLSDVNRLQDNYKYQSYSYIIKSTISQNQWVKRFKDLMHPAGMEVFGDLIITNNINFGPFIEIITDGLNLHVFKTEDIVVSNDDSINIVVQWVRSFTDVVENLTDTASYKIDPTYSDVVGVTSEFDEYEYAGPDYLPENYVGSGLSKHLDKNLTETATILDALSTSVDYNRTLTDQISNITDSILITVLVSRILSDSTNAATDEIALSVDKSFVEVPTTTDLLTVTLAVSRTLSDSVTTNEINSIAVDKLLDDVSSSSDVINIESAKPISDSATASEILATLTSYTRSFDEALGSSDVINIESAKPISDSVSTADILSSILSFRNNLTDIATVNDSIVASLDISRVIYCDAAAAGELNSIEVDKSLLEITSASDDYYQEYVEGDYLPLNYTGSGISKYVEKVLTNVVSHIDYVSINIDKGVIVEERTASEINIKTLQKPFTETGNIADGGVITIQDYSDPTFFSEDYVGAGYNF